MTENGAFKLRSDIHTSTAPSCRGSNRRFTIEKSREATTHKSPQSSPFKIDGKRKTKRYYDIKSKTKLSDIKTITIRGLQLRVDRRSKAGSLSVFSGTESSSPSTSPRTSSTASSTPASRTSTRQTPLVSGRVESVLGGLSLSSGEGGHGAKLEVDTVHSLPRIFRGFEQFSLAYSNGELWPYTKGVLFHPGYLS